MGSGTSRKSNDSVIINRPKIKRGSGAGGGQEQSQNRDMNIICPPTLKVRLNLKKPLPEGVHLILEKEDVIFSSQKVGSLTKSQFVTLTRCITEGFHYSGKVVNEGNNQYGVFTRQ